MDNRRAITVATPNNLPAELTTFIGREPQLAELRRLLRKSRLLTLTGPGGAGKTRLALRLATSVLDRFPDGVWLVELASVTDPKLLEQTIASTVGIREEKSRSVAEALIGGLARRRSLLILDSTEHLVDACADLAGHILRACPAVALLVTSREPLGVSGELIWRTPSLTVPRAGDAEHPELLLQSEAVRLFVDRASLSRPGFDLDRSASAAVAAITSRLEGIPLAIELAAGLTATMTLPDIVDGLRDRFRLLTGGSRSSLPRHQTLRQAVDWSYRLLTAQEQELLAAVATFAGGFDLNAVVAVAGSDADVRSLLQRLVTKSLVMVDPSKRQRSRYYMLDTIREYALEKLHEQGDTDVRQRHAEYFADWSTTAIQQLASRDQQEWLERFAEELANIRLALEWTLVEKPESALVLATSFSIYATVRGLLGEGMDWLNRALSNATPQSIVRAGALGARARIHRRQGDLEAARRDAEGAVQIARELGDDNRLANALTTLAILASSNGHFVKAERFHRQTLELARRGGNQRAIAMCLGNLAGVAALRGKYRESLRLIDEAFTNFAASGDRFSQSVLLENRGAVFYLLGDVDASEAGFLEAFALATEFQNVETTAEVCDGLGLVSASRRNPRRALTMWGAAGGLRLRHGISAPAEPGKLHELQERALKEARAEVGAQAADAAWREGESLSFQQIVDLVKGRASAGNRERASELSPREAEVARLLAAGLTNKEIAARLRMAVRTADAHAEHIRNKLGLRTRAQIAVWAHEKLPES